MPEQTRPLVYTKASGGRRGVQTLGLAGCMSSEALYGYPKRRHADSLDCEKYVTQRPFASTDIILLVISKRLDTFEHRPTATCIRGHFCASNYL